LTISDLEGHRQPVRSAILATAGLLITYLMLCVICAGSVHGSLRGWQLGPGPICVVAVFVRCVGTLVVCSGSLRKSVTLRRHHCDTTDHSCHVCLRSFTSW